MARNGYVSRSRLAAVDGGGWKALLAPGAAKAWLLYSQIVHRKSGVWPTISRPDGGYRSYARQLWWWVNRKAQGVVAAYPGTSNHGLGMAVDNWNWAAIPSNIRRQAAAQAGFIFDTPSEPWHMRYTGSPQYTSALSVTALEVRVSATTGFSLFIDSKLKVGYLADFTRDAPKITLLGEGSSPAWKVLRGGSSYVKLSQAEVATLIARYGISPVPDSLKAKLPKGTIGV